jgi:hypothetical protein
MNPTKERSVGLWQQQLKRAHDLRVKINGRMADVTAPASAVDNARTELKRCDDEIVWLQTCLASSEATLTRTDDAAVRAWHKQLMCANKAHKMMSAALSEEFVRMLDQDAIGQLLEDIEAHKACQNEIIWLIARLYKAKAARCGLAMGVFPQGGANKYRLSFPRGDLMGQNEAALQALRKRLVRANHVHTMMSAEYSGGVDHFLAGEKLQFFLRDFDYHVGRLVEIAWLTTRLFKAKVGLAQADAWTDSEAWTDSDDTDDTDEDDDVGEY